VLQDSSSRSTSSLQALEVLDLRTSESISGQPPASSDLKRVGERLAEDVKSLRERSDISDELMKHATRTISIFSSSTFTDTAVERDYLIQNCFPQLRDELRKIGDISLEVAVAFLLLNPQVVDLRWGITDEAVRSNQLWAICRAEIERCFKNSVGLSFLSLLADKYGYRPLPAAIQPDMFSAVNRALPAAESRLLNSLYREDLTFDPSEWLLQSNLASKTPLAALAALASLPLDLRSSLAATTAVTFEMAEKLRIVLSPQSFEELFESRGEQWLWREDLLTSMTDKIAWLQSCLSPADFPTMFVCLSAPAQALQVLQRYRSRNPPRDAAELAAWPTRCGVAEKALCVKASSAGPCSPALL
jgi:hypothetical protein